LNILYLKNQEENHLHKVTIQWIKIQKAVLKVHIILTPKMEDLGLVCCQWMIRKAKEWKVSMKSIAV